MNTRSDRKSRKCKKVTISGGIVRKAEILSRVRQIYVKLKKIKTSHRTVLEMGRGHSKNECRRALTSAPKAYSGKTCFSLFLDKKIRVFLRLSASNS